MTVNEKACLEEASVSPAGIDPAGEDMKAARALEKRGLLKYVAAFGGLFQITDSGRAALAAVGGDK